MARRFLRDNAFLVAAVSLPLAVVALFLLASALPRWTVPPPAYDLLLRTSSYDQTGQRVALEIAVRNERVEATARAVPANTYLQRSTLWLFDHRTMSVREIGVELPSSLDEREPPRTVTIDALKDRRVLSQTKAPDGYEVRTRARGGGGLISDLFGMRRYDQSLYVAHRGRVVAIRVPSPYEYHSPVFVAWLAAEGER